MTYRIAGLDPARFAPLLALTDEDLARHRARRVVADADTGYPCRVSLDEARAGEAAVYQDCCPPVFAGRTLSLRGFDEQGALAEARLAPPGAADEMIRALFADRRIAFINAHNAAAGCFAARIERDGQ